MLDLAVKVLFVCVQLLTYFYHLQMMIQQTEDHVQKHWAFNDKLSDLQQWITATTGKISSYQGAAGEQSTESRMADLKVRKAS